MSSQNTLIYFFFTDTEPTDIYTLSLHDALPISSSLHTGTPSCPGTTVWFTFHATWRSTPTGRLTSAGALAGLLRRRLQLLPATIAASRRAHLRLVRTFGRIPGTVV